MRKIRTSDMSSEQLALFRNIYSMISETNGLSLSATLKLLLGSHRLVDQPVQLALLQEFMVLLNKYHGRLIGAETLLSHPVSDAFRAFFESFALPYKEEHIHLTGSLTGDFLFPHIEKLLNGEKRESLLSRLVPIYGKEIEALKDGEHLGRLLSLNDEEFFDAYLKKLYLPKLVLTSREIHAQASYHMAKTLYEKYNVGSVRLKFTYSRATANESEKIPGTENLASEDVVLGLYEGFEAFKSENPTFDYVLSPSFRKEPDFYDNVRFGSKASHFNDQVSSIIELIEKYPDLANKLTDVDTVGDEKNLYKKEHFAHMRVGFRRLEARGIRVRSHHGETFLTLKKGIQAVDNAMNIWRIDTLEHGLALGINPNIYFQTMMERALCLNAEATPIAGESRYGTLEREIREWDFKDESIRRKILEGVPLSLAEERNFIKTKFYHALEVEHYQHDVLNRLIDKSVSLTALPSSNHKLTGVIPGFQDHPFSWWEKKGISLGVGTDNYVTLGTNYIKELLLLLYSEPDDLKIMKLLMVASGEKRRLHLSHLLWETKKELFE